MAQTMDPKLAETVTAQLDQRDQPALRALVGRFIQKYFAAYGTYTARIMEVDADRPVVVIQYEDGDTEEMHLDQIQRLIMPPSWRPPVLEDAPSITNSRYGLTWPPPTASHKMVVQGKRQRKPSERALQHQLFQHAMDWTKEAPASQPKSRQSSKEGRAAIAAHGRAKASASAAVPKNIRSTATSKPASKRPKGPGHPPKAALQGTLACSE